MVSFRSWFGMGEGSSAGAPGSMRTDTSPEAIRRLAEDQQRSVEAHDGNRQQADQVVQAMVERRAEAIRQLMAQGTDAARAQFNRDLADLAMLKREVPNTPQHPDLPSLTEIDYQRAIRQLTELFPELQ